MEKCLIDKIDSGLQYAPSSVHFILNLSTRYYINILAADLPVTALPKSVFWLKNDENFSKNGGFLGIFNGILPNFNISLWFTFKKKF